MKTLDLGCGRRKQEGAIGVDISPESAADVVWDLNQFPWPFPDDAFDLILCRHVLEHLDGIVQTMEEIHRVGKPGATVEIVTPHFSSLNSWDDPTHRHHLSLQSFDYFLDGERPLTYSARRFACSEKRLEFGRSLLDLIPRALYRLSRRRYEKHFAFIFPAKNLHFRLEVLKP